MLTNVSPMQSFHSLAFSKSEEDEEHKIEDDGDYVVVVVGRFVELKSPVTCNKCPPLVDHYST